MLDPNTPAELSQAARTLRTKTWDASDLEMAARATGWAALPDFVTLFPQQIEIIEGVADAIAQARRQGAERTMPTEKYHAAVIAWQNRAGCTIEEAADDVAFLFEAAGMPLDPPGEKPE